MKRRALLGATAHYRNYPELVLENWEKAYYGLHYACLQQLKARYDAANRCRHAQSVRLPG